jgi:hypothetical protein
MTRTIIGQMSEAERWLLIVLNQIFEIEKKLSLHGDPNNLGRNINRTKDAIEELGFFTKTRWVKIFRRRGRTLRQRSRGKGQSISRSSRSSSRSFGAGRVPYHALSRRALSL